MIRSLARPVPSTKDYDGRARGHPPCAVTVTAYVVSERSVVPVHEQAVEPFVHAPSRPAQEGFEYGREGEAQLTRPV